MQISFGDDAFDSFVQQVGQIPPGYTVALLEQGEDVPESSALVQYVDVEFLSADHDGVAYHLLDSTGERVSDERLVRGWDQVARVHIY